MAIFTFTNNTGFTINDALGVQNQSLNLYGTLGTITDVKVNLTGLIHSFAGDLDMLLVAPDGMTNLEFLSDARGTDEFGGNYVFENGAPVLSSEFQGVNVAPGSYGPSTIGNDESDATYGTATGGINRTDFAVFDGLAANGLWNFYLDDDAGGDSGTLTSWGLTVETDSSNAEITGTGGTDSIVVTSTNATDGSWNFNGNIVAFTGVDGFTLDGDSGTDTLTGGDGDDIIRGGLSEDNVSGGGGDDTFIVTGNEFIDNVDGGIGTDTLDHLITRDWMPAILVRM